MKKVVIWIPGIGFFFLIGFLIFYKATKSPRELMPYPTSGWLIANGIYHGLITPKLLTFIFTGHI